MPNPQMYVSLVSPSNSQLQTSLTGVADDERLPFGEDSDAGFVLRSTALATNTALTDVLEGTPVTPAITANSLIIYNVTDDGDIMIAASDGGTSKNFFHADASVPSLELLDGKVFIGNPLNDGMSVGLTINQAAESDEILSLKSSNITHGMTSVQETDTYAMFKKTNGSHGGLEISAANDTSEIGLLLVANSTTQSDTKTTGARAAIEIRGYDINGTGRQTLATGLADANIMAILDGTTTRFIYDVEGSAHADVEWVAFDDHDDVTALRDFETMLDPSRFPGRVRTYGQDEFEDMGIIGKDSVHMEGDRLKGMVNFTKLSMLHHGAIQQVHDELQETKQRMLALEAPNA